MKRVWQFLGILLLLVIVTGLGIYAFTPRPKLLSYIAPKIQVVKISNLRVANNQATFQLHLQATSTFLPVTINKLQYQFKLYDQIISQGNATIASKQSHKVQPVTLPIRVNYSQALSLVQRQLTDEMPINAGLEMLCRIPLVGSQTINRQENLELFIPVLPAPEITKLAIQDIGFQHARLVLTLQIANPNKFDYYVRDLSLSAQFPNYLALAENIPEPYLIKAHQVTAIKIPSTKAISNAEKNTLFPENSLLTYQMKTAMNLEPVQVAIDPISFNATQSGSVRVPPNI